MGERFARPQRHANTAAVLRRVGIGHNGGPTMDMSGIGWVWRRAVAKAWKNPPREIALRRIARAEALGLTYREYTAVLLDNGANLSAALVPLAALVGRQKLSDGNWRLIAPQRTAAAIARFRGRLFCLVDQAECGEARPWDLYGAELYRLFDGRVESVEKIDGETGGLAAELREILQRCNVPRREAFLVGSTPEENVAAEAAGLGLFKPFAAWVAALSKP
jgi:hypothetical protein